MVKIVGVTFFIIRLKYVKWFVAFENIKYICKLKIYKRNFMIMKERISYLFACLLIITSCNKYQFDDEAMTGEQVKRNVEKVFGYAFDPNHDWCMTTSGEVTINDIPDGTKKVQLFVYVEEADGETSILTLNESDPDGASSIKLFYDAPKANLGLYTAFISDDGIVVREVMENTTRGFAMVSTSLTRGTESYPVPSVTPIIGYSEDSYASLRGWVAGEKLYSMSDYSSQQIQTDDYSDEFKKIFRTVIFSYFKNGRNYNNLPLVIESGLYNDKAYPVTTGDKPIVVTPVYKRDGAKTYGNEVYNSDIYYYYFKEGELEASSDAKKFLEALPKYKAFSLSDCFGDSEDDVIGRKNSYMLVYWGDGTPEIGTVGSYQFPKGYKIGFMVRAKTAYENGKKQGELYGDGRLNSKINTSSSYNFRSSGLGTDGPRSAWITLEKKMLLCFESGTDKDFNDIILEVEGGVKPIINIPDIESNCYTYCFEDTPVGDYDLNDVVIRARRLNDTQVEYSLVACGAVNEIKIMGINGNIINSNKEVHELFGVEAGFVNTIKGAEVDPVVDVVTVNKSFSFLDENTQPYIYDITNDVTIKLSKKGQDPHGIMVPYEFRYPLERNCVKNAYQLFNNWGQNRVTSTDWYTYPEDNKVW